MVSGKLLRFGVPVVLGCCLAAWAMRTVAPPRGADASAVLGGQGTAGDAGQPGGEARSDIDGARGAPSEGRHRAARPEADGAMAVRVESTASDPVAARSEQRSGADPVGHPEAGVLTRDSAERSTAERPRPLREAPGDAVNLPGVSGAKAWAVLERAPRGVRGEVPRIGGAAELRVDRRPERTLRFRVTALPDGVLELPPRGVVEIDPRRDAALLPIAGAAPGRAVLRFELLDDGGSATGAIVPLEVVVEALADAPEPVIFVVPPGGGDAGVRAASPAGNTVGNTAGNTASDAGCCERSASSVTGLRGMPAGTLVIGRTPFRYAAHQATNVEVVVADPEGVLVAPPRALTVPPGASRSEPWEIRLSGAVGDARLTFRAGASECSFLVRSVEAAWSGPAALVVPSGAEAALEVTLATRPLRVAGLVAASARPEIVAAGSPPDPGRAPGVVLVPLVAGTPGECDVTLSAAGFPQISTRVVTVEAETAHVGGLLRLLRVPAGARGRIALKLPRGGTFADAPRNFVPPKGVALVAGWGTGTLSVSLSSEDATEVIEIPARIEGVSLPVRVSVTDEVRMPRRARHSIEAR